MPEALPTSILSAMFWATIGSTFVQLRWRATHDQLSVLWLMAVFAFGLAGAPLIHASGWKFGLSSSALAVVAPAIAYHFHLGGTSTGRSERWSIAFYATLLSGCAMAALIMGPVFVRDFSAVTGVSVPIATAVLQASLVAMGAAGVMNALHLRMGGDRDA